MQKGSVLLLGMSERRLEFAQKKNMPERSLAYGDGYVASTAIAGKTFGS